MSRESFMEAEEQYRQNLWDDFIAEHGREPNADEEDAIHEAEMPIEFEQDHTSARASAAYDYMKGQDQ